MKSILDIFDGFNELVQLAFGFALGLAFSQADVSVGWIFAFIIIWEFSVYLLFHNSIYYNPFFRVAYNCLFLLSVLIGQYIYYGKTTFQDFLYPNTVNEKVKTYSGTKYSMTEKVEIMMDKYVDDEEKKNKKKKLRKKYRFYRK